MIPDSTSTSECLAASQAGPLKLRAATRPVIAAYHEICSDVSEYRYALSSRLFEDHLQLAVELRDCCQNAEIPFTITFDDGHISNYTHALPLLQKYSCKATFFVIVGRIGRHKDFMTWAHLRELVSLGHRVQSHSWSHKFLTECQDQDLKEELLRSRETLQERLAAPVHAISAPHGRWDRRVLTVCGALGYRQLYTSNPWSSTSSKRDRLGAGGTLKIERADQPQAEVTGRLVVIQSMDSARLLRWLAMGQTEAAIRRCQYALKRSVQRSLGDRLYYRLWARMSGWNGPEDTAWDEI